MPLHSELVLHGVPEDLREGVGMAPVVSTESSVTLTSVMGWSAEGLGAAVSAIFQA